MGTLELFSLLEPDPSSVVPNDLVQEFRWSLTTKSRPSLSTCKVISEESSTPIDCSELYLNSSDTRH